MRLPPVKTELSCLKTPNHCSTAFRAESSAIPVAKTTVASDPKQKRCEVQWDLLIAPACFYSNTEKRLLHYSLNVAFSHFWTVYVCLCTGESAYTGPPKHRLLNGPAISSPSFGRNARSFSRVVIWRMTCLSRDYLVWSLYIRAR